MLTQHGRRAEIAVVGHFDQHVGSIPDVFAGKLAKVRFETDHHARFGIADRQDVVFAAIEKLPTNVGTIDSSGTGTASPKGSR